METTDPRLEAQKGKMENKKGGESRGKWIRNKSERAATCLWSSKD